MTDFVLRPARNAEEGELLGRTVFALNSKAYSELLARLDEPPRPNDRLRCTLETAAPWEK